MFGIMKKGLMVAGVGALAVGAVLGARPAWSYVTTAMGIAREKVESAVPFAVELERLDHMVASLDRVIEENERKRIAQEVRLERLEAENSRHEEGLSRAEKDLRAIHGLLQAEAFPVSAAGRSWTRETLEAEALRRVGAFRAAKDVLEMRVSTAVTLREAIAMSRRQTEEACRMREERAQQVAALRADKMKVDAKRELAATVRGTNFADPANRFDEVNRLFDRLRERLEVENRILDREVIAVEAPVDFCTPQGAPVESQLEELLGIAPAPVSAHPGLDETRTFAGETADARIAQASEIR